MTEIITRDAAIASGLKRYFTGLSCSHGHIDERWIISRLCLECAREFKRAHYVIKPRKRMTDEERIARERMLARAAYHRNSQIQKDRAKRWRSENALHVLAYSKNYNRTRVDPIGNRKRVKAWLKANPLKKKQQTQLRRSRKAKAVGTFSASDIEALMQEQRGLCLCGCDISKAFTIDHKTPLCRGGSNWPDNLQLLCRRCNASKGPKTMDEWVPSLRLDARDIQVAT